MSTESNLRSMTGFGRGQTEDARYAISVEVSSVNRKGLEIGFSLPREWQVMERELGESVRARVSRGKVQVQVQVEDKTASGGLAWDDLALKAALARLQAFAAEQGFPFEPTPELMIRLIAMTGTQGGLPAWEGAIPLVKKALMDALDGFEAMRQAEGTALKTDLQERSDKLGRSLQEIREASAGVVPRYRELLGERLQKAGLSHDLNDERVLRELALFADRCDISEELTRLESHLQQLAAMLSESGGVGRKLDFLCQELNREINTIGSKSNSVVITRQVLEMKNELERIREQVQNIE